jgi:MFS family permease
MRVLPPLRIQSSMRPSILRPFEVRSFRFQWPADLLTSWAIEMEILILGWYILVETGSIVLLTLFGALQYVGTLIAPLLGLAGDRFGHRNILCAMRALYGFLAGVISVLASVGEISPISLFAVAAMSGLVRPSDLAMRNALVAETIPTQTLMAAMGVARTTSDSARIVGALAGAGLLNLLGFGLAYCIIFLFYLTGFLLTLGVGSAHKHERLSRVSFWHDLGEGMAFIAGSPHSLAAMWLAFLVNMTAYPLTSGLLPYVAREIYHIGQTGLATLTSCFAIGACLGSVVVSLAGRLLPPARMMIVFAVVWYGLLLLFIQMPDARSGRVLLFAAGFAQSLCMVPMAVMLLHGADEKFRGRVMGVRMMAIYGLPIGLVAAGLLVDQVGFVTTCSSLCGCGVVLTLAIAFWWRHDLLPANAPANAR